jgi:hypothetical protein
VFMGGGANSSSFVWVEWEEADWETQIFIAQFAMRRTFQGAKVAQAADRREERDRFSVNSRLTFFPFPTGDINK